MLDAPTNDLEGLLIATARGDRKAFATLYQAASAKLFGIVLRIIKDRGKAEEILQETFIRIWRKAEAFDPRAGRPITWMAAIAHNAAVDELRRGGMVQTVSIDDEEADPLANVADPRAAFDPVELETLRTCLGRLEPTQKACVLLAYYEGYSREELSERFDRPVGTIKTWLHRALAALQDCLGAP